jgi:hypothetical protein
MGHMSQPMILIAGMFIGGLAMLCIVSIIGFFRGQAVRRLSDKRDEIIASVEGKLADADNLIAHVRSGRMQLDAFKDSLAEKLEAVNRIYKPHIHHLDIFFVKYIEKAVQEYTSQIGMQGSTAPEIKIAAQPQAADVAEPAASSVVEPEAAAPAAAIAVEQDHAKETLIFDSPSQEALGSGTVETGDAPSLETEIPAEEPVIEAMTQAAQEEDELPLETFLEMETGAGMIEEPLGNKPGLETQVRELEFQAVQPTPAQEEPPEEDLIPPSMPQSAIEEALEFPPQAGLRTRPEPIQPEIELPKPNTPPEISGWRPNSMPQLSEIEETLEFAPPSSFGTEPEPIAPQSIPLPRSFPVPPLARPFPSAPVFSSEEIARPATIYDVEAETIIADRSSILGSPPAPVQETTEDKKNFGITGEDVMDTFDKFFGIGK